MKDPREKTIRINGREITIKLSESQLDVLLLLSQKFGHIVAHYELASAFSVQYKNNYVLPVFNNGGTSIYGWNCRIHIAAIRKQIQPHGFDILSKRNAGYKLIDKVNPMNDPRDDFETIYATRFEFDHDDGFKMALSKRIEYIKLMRDEYGGYKFNDHVQDCWYIYLMAISKGENK